MIKLTLTADRKLVGIAADNFTITFNGLDNLAYKAALLPLGIELSFTAPNDADTPTTTTLETKD